MQSLPKLFISKNNPAHRPPPLEIVWCPRMHEQVKLVLFYVVNNNDITTVLFATSLCFYQTVCDFRFMF